MASVLQDALKAVLCSALVVACIPAHAQEPSAPAKGVLVIHDSGHDSGAGKSPASSASVQGGRGKLPTHESPLPMGQRGYSADDRVSVAACAPQDAATSKFPLIVMPGDLLSQKVSEWAVQYGYDVSWEAPEFQSNGKLTSQKDFSDSLADLKRAMDLNGIPLEITLYENCVVRIVETTE